jgi:hypothetical protein
MARVPAWVPVFGAPKGFAGCVAKTLMYPGVDNSDALIALKRATGAYNPPLRVFTPDGQLSGYIVTPGGFVDSITAASKGLIPAALLDLPPTPMAIDGITG